MKYRKGYKYQTVGNEVFFTPHRPSHNIITDFCMLRVDGKLVVFDKYAWDGPSGPTLDTKNSMSPSLYHDAMAQLMRNGFVSRSWRISTNIHFYKMLRKRGMSYIRGQIWLRALNAFGQSSVEAESIKKIYEVE